MSVTILIKGLCLWLTTASTIAQMGGLPGIIPDFSNATPVHAASISVLKADVVGNQCPAGFTERDGTCSFGLNGKGLAGGVIVQVNRDGEEQPVSMDPLCVLCAVPPIQHLTALELKPEYSLPGGSAIAAQVVIDQGSAHSTWEGSCNATNCARFVAWTLDSATGSVSLTLSNLQSGTPIEVPLQANAVVTIENSPFVVGPLKKAKTNIRKSRAHAHAHAATLVEKDWCLYFQMFAGDPPCPGTPQAPPPCPECGAGSRRDAKRLSMTFQTIACSNSTYP